MAVICFLFAFLCAEGTHSPVQAIDIAPVTRPALARPQLRRAAVRAPKPVAPAYWDSTCKVQPPNQYRQTIRAASQRYARAPNPCKLAGQIKAESEWQPDARSPAGALGIAQFMPGTAADLGFDPLDPIASIYGQARYMDYGVRFYAMEFPLRTEEEREYLALALYNFGPGNMRKLQAKHPFTIYTGEAELYVPEETRLYVAKIRKWTD